MFKVVTEWLFEDDVLMKHENWTLGNLTDVWVSLINESLYDILSDEKTCRLLFYSLIKYFKFNIVSWTLDDDGITYVRKVGDLFIESRIISEI